MGYVQLSAVKLAERDAELIGSQPHLAPFRVSLVEDVLDQRRLAAAGFSVEN